MVVEEAPEEAQDYPVKRGHRADTDLRKVMEQAFGEVHESKTRTAEVEGDVWLETSFGHINKLEARYYKKSSLWVVNDQKDPKEIDFENEMDTIEATRQAWNDFLNGATGYTAKERSKKMKERAKDS